MKDLSDIGQQFAAIVKEQLEESAQAADKEETQSRIAAAIMARPFLLVPQDLMTIFGIGKTKAYDLVNNENFPKTFHVGRKRWVRTEDFIACIDKLSE